MIPSRLKAQAPNALTLLRMACAVSLLFIRPFSLLFWALCLSAGISDILDGYLARKWHAQSRFGAGLDSAADFILVLIVLSILIPHYHWPAWVILWISIISLIRFGSILICLIRFHQLAFFHTYSNKATGFLLFCFPLLLFLFHLSFVSALLCIFATVSAIEELIINIESPLLNRDVKSIWIK